MNTFYDAAFIEKPYEDGVTKNELDNLFNILNCEKILTLEVEGSNSVATGLINYDSADSVNFKLGMLRRKIEQILSDMKKEREDHTYKIGKLTIWLSR